MIPFQEACLHAKNKLYPCFKQKIAQYFYIVLMLTIGGYVGVSNLFDFHLDLSWHAFIVLAIVVGIYVYLYYKVFRCYGITFWGSVDFDRYAEYIVANYWKNIQYDIEHGLLKSLLLDAKKSETHNISTLSEILKNIITSNSNSYQKRYVIDCILEISDNKNILSYTEEHLIPMAKNDNDVMYFLIARMHRWCMKNRDIENIELYLTVFKEVSTLPDFVKAILYNLVAFMNSDFKYWEKYNQLRNDGHCASLDDTFHIKIAQYHAAEKKIFEEINEYYERKARNSDPFYSVKSERTRK